MEETEEETLAKNKIQICEKTNDKKEKKLRNAEALNCIYKVLHNITKAQDITNLKIRSIIDNSEDPRWLPIHIVDDANGIILDISRYKGNPQPILRSGYTEDKVKGIINKWTILNRKS